MNPHKGDYAFNAGGKTYTLRYSHLALVKLEQKLDKGLMQIMSEIGKPENMRLRTVVVLLWAGLQKHHPNITEDETAELLDEIEGGASGTVALVDAAFNKAFGAASGTKGTNPQKEVSNGSGMTSSSNMPVVDTTLIPSGTSRPGN